MPEAAHDPLFVTPAWLAERLSRDDVVAIEASFYLPDEGKDADALFAEAHLPGAVRFDVDAIADQTSSLPHMLPDAGTFGRLVGQLGIGTGDTLVIYDATDLLGGARAWWMFRHFGAKDVYLLEGGLRAWRAAGLPLESGQAKRKPKSFHATTGRNPVVAADGVLDASRSGSAQIVDARSAARFAGDVAEPRPGLRAGHIPASRNLPWRAVLDRNGNLQSREELATLFRNAGIDTVRPIIASCGSGVSAAVLLLGLARLGIHDAALYDGSWSEWGGLTDYPLETGAASRMPT